jgi:hypothetical protein
MPVDPIKWNRYDSEEHTTQDHKEDLTGLHFALDQVHNLELHDWGVAHGLQVSGTGTTELVIGAGAAIDGTGQLITLAQKGQGDLGTNPPAGQHSPIRVPVHLSTTNRPKTTLYLTLRYQTITDPNSGSSGKDVQTPWLRLQLARDANGQPIKPITTIESGTDLVLAIVVTDASGKVTELKAADKALPYRRRLVGQELGELRFRRTSEVSGKLEESTAGTIAPGAAGELRITVPAEGDKILLERDDGQGFGGLEVRASTNISGALTITNNVGIGTSTPGARLEVKGATADNTTGGLHVTDSAAKSLLYVRNDGNVGVGTTEPLNALHVVRPGHLNVIFDQPNTSDHLTVVVGTEGSGLRFSSSNAFIIGSQPYGDRNDYGSGKEHVRITSEGHVGIGTTTPRRALDVLGNIVATNMTLAQDAGRDTRTWHLDNDGGLFRIFDQPNIDTPGTARLTITADGNVGIGTSQAHGRVTIESESVPLSFRETNHPVDQGGWWRMPLDGGTLRFDVNTGSLGQEFGANFRTVLSMHSGGSARISGRLGTSGFDPDAGYPSGWGGGIHTWDVYAESILATGSGGQVGAYLAADGRAHVGSLLSLNGDMVIQGRHALRGNDTWLRLNQELQFANGVHTPGLFYPGALNVGGAHSAGSPGTGNAWISGSLTVGAGGNGSIKVRHIDGKDAPSDRDGGLHLNWATGQNVYLGFGNGRQSSLLVSGRVGIGTMDPQVRLDINGAMLVRGTQPGDGNVRITGRLGTNDYPPDSGWSDTGVIGGVHTWDLIYHGGIYRDSTIRVKEHIQPLTGVLDRIEQLNPVRFDYRETKAAQRTCMGFIAEEMYEIIPECVVADNSFFARGVNENSLHALAIAGLQELARKVKILERDLGRRRLPTRTRHSQPRRNIEPAIAILREGVDSAGTGEAYVTVKFIADHAELEQIEAIRTFRLPPDILREQFLQKERQRWIDTIDAI